MRISEVEGIKQDPPQEVQLANLKAVVLTNIEGAIRELQKANFVEVQRGFGIDVDDGVAEDAPIESAREEYLSAVLQLGSKVEEMSPECKSIIETLVQAGQGVPQDSGAQTRVDMAQAAERQAQGNQDLTMSEMRVKEFTLNEEQTRQAIQMFGQHDEETPADVRATAAELSAALPQQLADIAQRLQDTAPEEAFNLQAQRVDLVAQVEYYESFVKVLDVAAPAPDQNALTEADMNLRADGFSQGSYKEVEDRIVQRAEQHDEHQQTDQHWHEELTDEEIDKIFEQAESTGKGMRQVDLQLNIDEVKAVNENNINAEERMNRAQDLNNRQFLDSITNQATKNNFVDQSQNESHDQDHRGEVSVKDDPSVLFTREWKDVKEMREICEHVFENSNLQGKDADQVKETLNRGLREEMKDPKTEAGRAVNEALRQIMDKQEEENDFFKKRR